MATAKKPQFSPVDEETADLLDLIANDQFSVSTDRDYDVFVDALKAAARQSPAGTVRQNVVRKLIDGRIFHKRVGPFYRRASLAGLIRATGDFEISDDKAGRNSGKPCRVYEWTGGAL